IVVIETPSLRDMIDWLEFDTIYHEHNCYFSLTALASAFAREGLEVVDVEHLDVHGGSLRVFGQRDDGPKPDPVGVARVTDMLAAERSWGVEKADRYARFADEVELLKKRLVDLIRRLRQEGRSIVAYGASAKGATLLNYCGLGRREIAFVVDRSTVKQGRF